MTQHTHFEPGSTSSPQAEPKSDHSALSPKREKRVEIHTYHSPTEDAPPYDDWAGGPTGLEIQIVFINGQFAHALFPFQGKYTRHQWRLLVMIEAEIARLENLASQRGDIVDHLTRKLDAMRQQLTGAPPAPSQQPTANR